MIHGAASGIFHGAEAKILRLSDDHSDRVRLTAAPVTKPPITRVVHMKQRLVRKRSPRGSRPVPETGRPVLQHRRPMPHKS